MFAPRYFPGVYFAGRYFPQGPDAGTATTPPVTNLTLPFDHVRNARLEFDGDPDTRDFTLRFDHVRNATLEI